MNLRNVSRLKELLRVLQLTAQGVNPPVEFMPRTLESIAGEIRERAERMNDEKRRYVPKLKIFVPGVDK